MSAQVDIAISAAGWSQTPEAEEIVRRSIAASESFFDDGAEETELSILLCDDAEIRRLNRQWRGKDKATNVLSFPSAGAPSGARHLGDIAIAYETVAREAVDEGKTIADHLAHLTVHGYLHLVGFDHETDADAEEMEGLEREILAALGVDDPYSNPAETSQTLS